MGNDLDIRLKTDRAFIEYLCEMTGKSASALSSGAGMAPTTLNRFLSKVVKLKSSLKDTTIRKLAQTWGFDYLELMAYRKKIEDSLREGKSVPDFRKTRFKTPEARILAAAEPLAQSFDAPDRDPLIDQIMGAAYDVWFHSSYKNSVPFDRLPDLVRLLYSRARAEKKPPSSAEIKKRAADMLAAIAMKTGRKKR
jgi:hypothetical protein